jgi:outer membrane protein
MRSTRVVLTAGFLASTALGALGQAGAQPPHKKHFVPAGPGMSRTIPTDQLDTVPTTLSEALAAAYENNPQLTGERAHLRSIDENVPTALAGWRPTVTVTGSYGWAVGRYEEQAACSQAPIGDPQPGCPANTFSAAASQRTYTDALKDNRTEKVGQATVTQYLYRGGKTTASTHEAVNSVLAERARLIAEEETVFTDTVNAYVTVVEDKQLLELDRANEQVLGDELRAIDDRFKVGELTRTDVAQSEAALAQAIATRQTAEGNLATARATFARQVGVEPPADLIDPQPLHLPVKSAQEAYSLALDNNPNVIAAKFNESQLRDAVDVAFAQLGPNVSLQGSGFYQGGSSLNGITTYGASALINVTIPLYQGGQEYAAIRQARQNYLQAVRQTEDAQREARELAVQAWETLTAAQASIGSAKVAVRSSEIALEGLEREALVGSATTQEVLIGQQNLLTAQITLVQDVTAMVNASYGVASAIGRLTAADLGLQVPLYDETAYYKAVKDRLWGTGDHALSQPGR